MNMFVVLLSLLLNQHALALRLPTETIPLQDQKVASPNEPNMEIDGYGRILSWKGKDIIDSDAPHDSDFLKYIHGQGAQSRTSTSLEEYLDTCHNTVNNTIQIGAWCGRTGNNLWQVHTAIIMALRSGRRYVRTPEHPLFDFPEDGIPIDPADSLQQCVFHNDGSNDDCNLVFYVRCESTVSERKAVYLKYILPYFKGMKDCNRGDADALTMHVRSGDLANQAVGCHAQPPCAYFDKIISEGKEGRPFGTVNIFTNGWPRNPCIDEILSKHADKTINIVDQESEAHDYCSMIVASNLAVTTSSFSTTAKTMNTGLKRLFYPGFDWGNLFQRGCQEWELHVHEMGYDFNEKEVCDAFPMAVRWNNETSMEKCKN